MFYNITRAVTIAFNALRDAVVWSNMPVVYKYSVNDKRKKISRRFVVRVGNIATILTLYKPHVTIHHR